VKGEKPYINIGWESNPFIDKEAYEQTLAQLDYIDQQYQRYGDWEYQPSVGDLINREEITSQIIQDVNSNLLYSIIGIDLAGKGKDKFAVCRYDLLQNGFELINDFNQTESSMPEDMLIRFVEKHNPNKQTPLTSLIVIEQEGGGSPLYAQRYFQELLIEQGFNIPVILKFPKGSKYQRCRPLMSRIRQGNVKIKKDCGCLEEFIEESVRLMPIMKKSPNLVDSVSLAHSYIHDNILNQGTSIKLGARI
jgi:hypothetical protein